MTRTIKTNLRWGLLLFCISGMAFLIGCSSDDDMPAPAFSLSSSVSDGGFNPGGVIPKDFRDYRSRTARAARESGAQCDGKNDFPKLSWSNPPTGTKSYVLIVYDSSALDFVHLNLSQIRYTHTGIPRIVDASSASAKDISGGSTFGTYGTGILTSWMGEETHWRGPCPPSGKHTYVFKLYAMDEYPLTPELTSGTFLSRQNFESSSDYKDNLLGSTEISGQVTP